jgi:hypothetical protein
MREMLSRFTSAPSWRVVNAAIIPTVKIILVRAVPVSDYIKEEKSNCFDVTCG